MKNITEKNKIIRLSLYIGIVFVAMILTYIPSIVYSWYLAKSYTASIIAIIIGIILYALFSYFLYIFWKKQSKEYNDFESSRIELISIENVTWFIGALIIYIVYHIGISQYLFKVDNPTNQDLTWYFILVVFIFQAIYAPIVEELVTRGLFFSLFFRKNKKWNTFLSKHLPTTENVIRIFVASVISICLSSVLHGDVSDMAMTGLMVNATLCVILYYKTKHIMYPILLHMFNNNIVIVSLILSLLQS